MKAGLVGGLADPLPPPALAALVPDPEPFSLELLLFRTPVELALCFPAGQTRVVNTGRIRGDTLSVSTQM